ncbi:MAG: ATP phosphoribosyltransferase regulatory subunit [Proteobacteria bacterium]|nr:ATP phosphoribosyltransferase regulatory subunit [Pseudomonadota bacterium]
MLPPDCAFEHKVAEDLIACFATYGFERVKPPLVEFEQNLLGGVGGGMANRTFRMMDPLSQRMMAVRSDMTLQIARIASTRLAGVPRPLRLSYAGDVLRVVGSQLSPERQFTQVGVELIGSDAPAADAEAILLAAEAVGRVGITGLSIDLMLPTLVRDLMDAHGVEAERRQLLRQAIDRKDAEAVGAGGDAIAHVLGRLLTASGPLQHGLSALDDLSLPASIRDLVKRLKEVIASLGREAPGLTLTLDAVENRGFQYHTGVSFSLFVRGVRGELGRGGRYIAGERPGEPATGFTLYMDTVIRALPEAKAGPKLYLPYGLSPSLAMSLRQAGWVAVAGLEPVADAAAEARRLGCSHLATPEGTVVPSERAA